MYEVLVEHQTIYEQSNEDDYRKVNYKLQQNRQQDDRQNYSSGPILIDVFVQYPKTIKINKILYRIVFFFTSVDSLTIDRCLSNVGYSLKRYYKICTYRYLIAKL